MAIPLDEISMMGGVMMTSLRHQRMARFRVLVRLVDTALAEGI